MTIVEITYDPYKLSTQMLVDGRDVCDSGNSDYDRIKDFINNKIPLQTWIEPINGTDWTGFVDGITPADNNDRIDLHFSGRKIDFDDLKQAIKNQNNRRKEECRVTYQFHHDKKYDDVKMSKNIDEVVTELKSEWFKKLVDKRNMEGLKKKYANLEQNYDLAKKKEFQIVLAGMYSSGKSTLLNALIRHDILPADQNNCTAKIYRIRNDATLGRRISLKCYDNAGNPLDDVAQVFDDDAACAQVCLEICPPKLPNAISTHPEVEILELSVDLSHLYPSKDSQERFEIVFIDTPGIDSAQSSVNGLNLHAEAAKAAIADPSKPMILLCVDATNWENKNIGEFMREIVAQAEKDKSGFNDRFLFLMNKGDHLEFSNGETIDNRKASFAQYLTDPSRWGIREDEDELEELADSAKRFVPRIYLTASLIACAIQHRAYQFTREERDEDDHKYNLLEKYEKFNKYICSSSERRRENYLLTKHCDLPAYRKEKFDQDFQATLESHDDVAATDLQCGIVAVESAIKDYIERYAYPIKVRDLLETFEDILTDVEAFESANCEALERTIRSLGEQNSEKGGVESEKERKEEKKKMLDIAREKIEGEITKLKGIDFQNGKDTLGRLVTDLEVAIENDKDITFLRENKGKPISTGSESHNEVQQQIRARISRIQKLFSGKKETLEKEFMEIQQGYDQTITEICGTLTKIVDDLEKSSCLQQGAYNFENTTAWSELKKALNHISTEGFEESINVVDKHKYRPLNMKKIEFQTSRSLFKKLISLFMSDFLPEQDIDGYYSVDSVVTKIDEYLRDLASTKEHVVQVCKSNIEKNKETAIELAEELSRELSNFQMDIDECEKKLSAIGANVVELTRRKSEFTENQERLHKLKDKIKES